MAFAFNSVTGASGESLGGVTNKEDQLKTQFATREGLYKLMTSAEYSQPNRVGYTPQANTPVKVSFISLPEPSGLLADKICFNVGRELFVYNYKGVKKTADLSKPIDKRVYKGTFPTCHDFNRTTVSPDGVHLLIGFSAGQIQLIDPIKKEFNRLYNEERFIDKTKVTCLKWVPGSTNLFLVSHSSGQLYVYKDDLPCGATQPHYQVFKQGDGYCVYTCKTKSTRNPLYRWVIGEGSINEFAFSPCSKYLAVVSQDGFLRVFHYDTMELVGRFRSYFGGLLCVAWSPDGKFIVTGGEDDLVTVYSFTEKRVVARGQGHKSWVSVVSFDEFTTSFGEGFDLSGSDENLAHTFQNQSLNDTCPSVSSSGCSSNSAVVRSSTGAAQMNGGGCCAGGGSGSGGGANATTNGNVISYRFGSVGQDTQLCLWDLNDDVLRQPVGRSRTSILISSPSAQLPSANSKCNNSGAGASLATGNHSVGNNVTQLGDATNANHNSYHNSTNSTSSSKNSDSQSQKREHKRNFSLSSRNSDKNSVNKATNSKLLDDPVRLLGSPSCPRLDEIPMLEPLICKKISHERLTALVFREDCFVTACQEGYVCTWARPGKWANSLLASSSPTPSSTCEEGLEESGNTIV